MPNLNHLNQSHPGELQVLPAATRLAHGVENAAALLDVGRTTVFELIRTGRLRAVKLGGRTLIPDAALREFLASLPTVAA